MVARTLSVYAAGLAFIARTQFSQILERVSEEKAWILVTKNGEAKAVIPGVEDFLQAVVKTSGSLRALQEEAERSGANKLTLDDIEAEIQAVRRTKSSKPV